MTSTSTQAKKVAELLQQAEAVTKRKTGTTAKTETKQATVTEEKFSDIETNTFYKIVFNDELSPEQKKEEVTKALTYTAEDGKEKNEARLKEFTVFKEYLQAERKRLAQEIISLTDTGAFSELKSVYDELNSAILNFEESMTPLTEIIDAVYKLRMAGGDTVLGVFKEIKDDKAEEERIAKQVTDHESKLTQLQGQIGTVNGDLAVLQNDRKHRKWFGMGGLKEEAIREIAAKQAELQDINTTIGQTAQEIADLKDPTKRRETQFAEFAEQKKKLRELLDISSDEHKARQKALVGSAQDFVDKTEDRVGSVLGHLDGMSDQIGNLFDVNNGMQNIYAIISEASKDASAQNQQVRDGFKAPADEAGESAIEKMQRETRKMAVEDHITALDASTVDTMKTFSDLATQGFRIKSMKDANREQIAKTRELHSSGVAGVADRLSTVLQAVSAAALNESSEMAKQSVGMMNDKTNYITMQEAMRSAMGIKDTAGGLNKAIDDLAQYADVIRSTSQISRDGLKEVKDVLQTLEEKTKEVQKEVKEAIAVNADVANDQAPATATPAAKKDAKPGNPFAKMGGGA